MKCRFLGIRLELLIAIKKHTKSSMFFVSNRLYCITVWTSCTATCPAANRALGTR